MLGEGSVKNKENNRVYILDAFRGMAVCGMIFHHSYVLLNFTYGVTFSFFSSTLFEVLQMVFVSVFLFVSGICTNYSRSTAKRGAVIFGAAIVVTIVTAVAMPLLGIYGLEIYFGILHMLGLSMLLYACIRLILNRCDPALICVFCLILFIGQSIWMEFVPYANDPYNILMVFGFPSKNFYSADYYPLFPYFFMFVAGTAIGRWIKKGFFPIWFYRFRAPFFEFIGRHSLLIYLLHQPIIFGIIMLVSLF